jgi:hypothetical protein
MKKSILNCTMILVLGAAAMQTIADAQETPGLEGVWFTDLTPVNCQTGTPIPNVLPFRALNLFSHDGSLTNESANAVPTLLRSSGVGRWQHTQGQMYSATFRFFNYNPDGSFMLMRKVTFTMALNGDQFASIHQFQDFDFNNKPLSTMGCLIGTSIRLQ